MDAAATRPNEEQSFFEPLRALPTWQKASLAGSLLLIVGGLTLGLFEEPVPAPTGGADGGSTVPPGGAGLVPGIQLPPGESPPPASASDDALSAGLFRLGFSFFAGFCMGYAARQFLRLLALASGVALFLLMLLSYGELITVHWDAFDSLFESFAQRVQTDSEKFQRFVTGSLPSAALAGTGLYLGFRRRSV